MKVLMLKTGRWSLNNGLGPIRVFEENEKVGDLSEQEFNRLEKAGWAQLAEADGEEDADMDSEDLDPKDTESILKNLIVGMDEDDAKSALQDWGTVNAGIKVSKAKNIENMIGEIVANSSSTDE